MEHSVYFYERVLHFDTTNVRLYSKRSLGYDGVYYSGLGSPGNSPNEAITCRKRRNH